MYQQPSAPRTIGGVLDDSIRLYRASFRVAWLPSLMLAAMGLAMEIYILRKFGVATTPQQMLRIYGSGSVQLANLVNLVVQLYLFLVLFAGMNAVATGSEPSLADSFASAARAMPGGLVAAFLFTLGVAVSAVLLLIPGLYVFGRLQYWGVAMMLDRAGPLDALSKSWLATQGHWWRTMTILTVLFVMLIVVWVVATFAGGIALIFARPDPVTLRLGSLVVEHLFYVVILPAIPACFVATYLDLRLRKWGGDLEARARELNPA